MGVRKVLESAAGFEMVEDVSTTDELFEKLIELGQHPKEKWIP